MLYNPEINNFIDFHELYFSISELRRPIICTLRPPNTYDRHFSPALQSFSSKATDDTVKQDQPKDSFDNFRAREEQKEQEFETQYKSDGKNKANESSTEAKDDKGLGEIETQILEAALGFVHDHSWSKQALAHGAESVGFAGTAHGMFERGGAELIDYFNHKCNQELLVYMEKLLAENKEPDPPPKFVAKAIEYRLRLLVPYKSQWPQALAIMTLPPNVPTALSSLLTMVDDICYYAGDRSVDVSIHLSILLSTH